MLRRFIPTAMLCMCLVLTGSAAGPRHSSSDTLFQDHFQDSAATLSKWVFDAHLARSFSAGALSLTNNDATYLGFATHSDAASSKAAVFTLSAAISISPSSSGVIGLACCMVDNDGIAIEVGTHQNLLVYTYGTGQILDNSINSFINPAVNTLTVSKHDSTFTVFCNSHFITTFHVSDSKFLNGGDIGLVLAPKAQATFDDVVMTKLYETGAPITCFSDDFNGGVLDGWYRGTISGSAQEANGALTLANPDAQSSSLMFVSGSFDHASLRVITSYKSGGGLYGLALVYAESVGGQITYPHYSFLIDSLRQYGYGHPDSGSIKLSQPKSYIHGSSGDGKDTLEILRFNTKYSFKINGMIVEDSLPIRGSGAVQTAGLFVMPQTSAAFDDFIIGGDSTGASCAVIAISAKPASALYAGLKAPGNVIMVFDATGRLVRRINGSGPGSLPRLPAGMFFLRQSNNGSKNVRGMVTIGK